MVPIITIDGPSGSGKGTIARRVAAACGFHLLDSGALYRLVALAGRRHGLAPDDQVGHAEVARTLAVEFGVDAAGEERIVLQGDDVTGEIRTETAGADASRVAAMPPVRAALLQRQRDFARPPGLVGDGRDMGTVVFPQAPLKIYLTASPEERAQRRHKQLKEKGLTVNIGALSQEIRERDLRDSTRPVAPLRPAEDAITLDSTGLTIEQVVDQVLALARSRLPAIF
ncbi:MAG TPA: (d)CMP kinase [Steroidobacteraceae bacterium]|nr:(d)CMP kinase [Steroidobacteraceae bacterium]